ncbi:MAG: uracil-xanthine permease family protein [Candidatus Ornithospirochaeta sp.]
MGQDLRKNELFDLNGKMPPLRYSLPMALQHLVAMIVGSVTPAIILSAAASLSQAQSVLLIQSSLVTAALMTLIELFWGARLPLIMGVSFAYLASMQAIVAGFGIAEVFGAQIIGGATATLVGVFAKKIQKYFPPLITGTVVFTIGLSLYPTAIRYMAGGAGSPDFGSWQNWLVAGLTLAVVVACNHYGKGIVKLSSILIGIAAGYIISIPFGMIDVSKVPEAAWFSLPSFMPFGVKFEFSAVASFSILFAINAVQAIGDMSATTMGGLDREPTGTELKRGIVAYGLSNIASALFGGLPSATYSQNVGIVSTTKVVNRKVFSLTALMLLAAGLVPKFSAILTTIPQCVLGGATVSVFSSIAMTGMKLVSSGEMNHRNTSIVGLAAALGVGISQVTEALAQFPEWVTMVFAKSPVVVATIVAIGLNIILPKGKDV